MARKYPEWTSEKDQMLLCAAHVHRDPANGFVKWDRVAAVVAQGAHSAKSCCGRHTYLIRNYSEAEKALSQIEDGIVTSEVSTPVSSPIKKSKSNKKGISDSNTADNPNSTLTTSNKERVVESVTLSNRRSEKRDAANVPSDKVAETLDGDTRRKGSKKNKKRSLAEDDGGQQEDSGSIRGNKKSKQNEKEIPGTADMAMKKATQTTKVPAPSTPVGPRAMLTAGSATAHAGNNTRFAHVPTRSSCSNPPQRQNSWSVPGYHSRFNRNWYQSHGNRGQQQGGNGEKWVDNVVQGFKQELLKGLRRQMGVP